MSSFLPINNMNHGQNYSPQSQSPPPQITNNKPPMTSAKKLTQMRKFFFSLIIMPLQISTPHKTNNLLLVISIHSILMVIFYLIRILHHFCCTVVSQFSSLWLINFIFIRQYPNLKLIPNLMLQMLKHYLFNFVANDCNVWWHKPKIAELTPTTSTTSKAACCNALGDAKWRNGCWNLLTNSVSLTIS